MILGETLNELFYLDQTIEQSEHSNMDGIHSHLLVCIPRVSYHCSVAHISRRDYADFNIPAPFSSRVRNALNAEPKSVKLCNLVGQGGVWYAFGVMIMRL